MTLVKDVLQGVVPKSRTPVARTTGVVCLACEDFGFVRATDRDGGPLPISDPFFGQLIKCPDCDLALRRRLEALRPLSGAVGDLRDCTFENFERVEGTGPSYKAALTWAQEPQGWLVLAGGYGSGKSHLAAAANNLLEGRLKPVLFVVVPDLLDHLRATFAPGSPIEYDTLFETVKAVAVLIMDDLAAENPTAWAQEKLYQILDYRTRLRLPTLITTNLLLEQFEGRMESRLCNFLVSHVVENQAADYRLSQRPRW